MSPEQQHPNILIAVVSFRHYYSFDVFVSSKLKERDMLQIHLACFFSSSHKERVMIHIHPACFCLTIASLLKERDLITQLSSLFCLIIA